jgi:RNA polymerase sigma-70 factor, ECF subfamily
METTFCGNCSLRTTPLAQYEQRPNVEETPMAKTLETSMVGYIDDLHSYAATLTRNREDVEDLVQETYVRALQAANRLRSDSNIKGWLWTILRNLWLNQVRQRNCTSKIAALDANDRAECMPAERSEDVSAEYERKWDQERLRRAVLRLPREFREIVVLREYQELSYADIAGLLACPPGTVMSRLARAREKLRYMLEFGPSKNAQQSYLTGLRATPVLGVEEYVGGQPPFPSHFLPLKSAFSGIDRDMPPGGQIQSKGAHLRAMWAAVEREILLEKSPSQQGRRKNECIPDRERRGEERHRLRGV